MRRRRLPIVDEITESCRLMSLWWQGFFFILGMIIAHGVMVCFYFYLETVILLQLLIILFLSYKYMVYRSISSLEVATKKKVIWVSTKTDESDKYKRVAINLGLILLTVWLFYQLQDFKLLLINSLFCFLFFLKIAFYVPLISIRVVTESDSVADTFFVLDKRLGMNTEIELYLIHSIAVTSKELLIETSNESLKVPLNFSSSKEIRNVKQFLNTTTSFKVK